MSKEKQTEIKSLRQQLQEKGCVCKMKTLKQQLQDDANKDFNMKMINATHVRIENAMRLFKEWLEAKRQEHEKLQNLTKSPAISRMYFDKADGIRYLLEDLQK